MKQPLMVKKKNEAAMHQLPHFWFALLLTNSLSFIHVRGQSDAPPIVWHLNQSFSVQASSPAFPQPQPNTLIFPFYPEIQQISNSSTALNASAFVFPCFFQPSANTSSSPSLSSTIFALFLTGVRPYQGPTSPLKGYPAIIWRANRLTPAHGETISLAFQEDGDLVLRGIGNDGVKTVAWRSNTSGKGVTRMELSQQPANLILYDVDNTTVWQSSDHPADILTYGQRLEEGMNLVSYASDKLPSAEYSLEVNTTARQLTLFFKKYASSQAIPYWILPFNGTSESGNHACGSNIPSCNAVMSPHVEFATFINSKGLCLGDPSDEGNCTTIQGLSSLIPEQDLQTTILRLDVDGSLKLLSIKEKWFPLADLFSDGDACSLPQACGTYGVCVGAEKQCKCPNVGAPLSSATTRVTGFVPSDPNDPSKGCTVASPLPTCDNSTIVGNAELNASAVRQQVQMQMVEGVDYFSALQGSAEMIFNVSSGDNCSILCLQNCVCLAAFWHDDLHVCSHIAAHQLGSFRGGLDSTIYKAYLKVSTVPFPVAPPGVASSIPPRPPDIHQRNGKKIAIGVGISVAALFVGSFSLFFLWRHKNRNGRGETNGFVSTDDNIVGTGAMLKLPPRYSYNELHAATKGFSHLLGKGGFGSVYAGVLADGTTKVAVKKLEGMRQGEKEFKTELAIMGGIHHYNLLQLMGYCAEGADRRLLVYKYMENGSLDQWLFAPSSAGSLSKDAEADEQSRTRLTWGMRYAIAVSVAKGLAYLHEGCEKRIIHLDIKPQNILLDEGFVAKVADFGLSRGMEREESHVMTTMRGTPGYLAPEWMRDGTIDVKCDVFSFGMLLMEIVSGRKNVDMSKTNAPFYPEWAYSRLVSDKPAESDGKSSGFKSILSHTRYGPNIIGKKYNPLHNVCTVDDLTDAMLKSEQERAQVLRLIMTAFLCVLERPEWRPPMSKVVQLLEGHISLSHIDLSSLHQGLIFVLGWHNSSPSSSYGYDSQALALRREFKEQLESILALSSTSFSATSSSKECSQVSGR